eukprot:5404514-Alexandrium_andersonii.AAC.1
MSRSFRAAGSETSLRRRGLRSTGDIVVISGSEDLGPFGLLMADRSGRRVWQNGATEAMGEADIPSFELLPSLGR